MKQRLERLAAGRFARDTVTTQVGLGVSAACGLVTAYLLWHGLGKELYGRYALVFALYALVNIIGDLGIGRASVSLLGEAHGAGDERAVNDHAGYVLKMTLLLGLSVTLVGVLAAPLLAWLVYGKPAVGPPARLLFLAALAGTGHAFVSTLLAGLRRMMTLAVLDTGFAVARLGAIGVALALGWGLWGVVGAHVAATLTMSVVSLAVYEHAARAGEALPGLRQLVHQAVHAPWRRTFALGALVSIDRQLVKLIEVAPVVVLGRLVRSDAPAGYFNLARNVMRGLGLAFNGLAKNLLPFFSELKGRRQFKRLWRDYRQAVVASGLVACGVAAVSVPLLPVALRLFRGGQAELTPVATVLLAKFVVDGFSIGLGAFNLVTGRVWWAARLKLVLLPFGAGAVVGGALLGQAHAADPLEGAAFGAAAGYAAWWIVLSLWQLGVSFRVLHRLASEEADP
ncbi:MAG: oligosaccharide flippase family protein [Verrucomicrobia bacterium]|nr:oligosaccharide flippase family protein [Verrucomicrobiota bacterium]